MPFTWSVEAGRYRDANGRFVREEPIRRALDQVIDVQAARMREATQALIDRSLSLADWQLQMMQGIKSAHLVGLAVAKGGWHQLDQADFGWVGQRIRTQYRFLARFAEQLASGKQPLNAMALRRAEMYAEAARDTHREAQRRLAREIGMAQERNRLGAADHCADCLAQTARGWVPVGTLMPIGSRQCLTRCRCSFSFRVAA